MKQLMTIAFILSGFFVFPQAQAKSTLGYYCGYSGSPTKVVVTFGQLLYEKKYSKIKGLLYSEDPAENFLAAVICSRLLSEKRIVLSNDDYAKISSFYHSQQQITLCDGCTGRYTKTLSELMKSPEEVGAVIGYYFSDE